MECNIYQTVKKIGFSKKKIQAIAAYTLKRVKEKKRVLSVHCIGDKRIHSLNREYRHIDRPTDVLSFRMQEGTSIMESDDLGDVFLAIPYIKRQAKREGVSFEEEFSRMLIHGILHLVGYDHIKKKDADIMFPLQEKILKHWI
ncbi:MAG: rRNA maturation RNase YbeY [Candidatus Magasanikbacteria bacterium]|jgi:probable rRNA maturation factor|nr:rRNA maturation RNase YbeY [Candidatus Magasanikbacteria bacterium]MBT4221182.1 rRNA maturation RNase YbeY [Candidatus Magasanikbacteria bacterium]MBT4350248.1 rRNA maturation RNase YbeY [Candidatus Magasanikbacteria bacterium]MBT4541675.1 rRNA maturation RNase YbeY [Candidatus Magasanikbacteria bacterium]MBT6253349.1 rRNA maturation RNase YbeY [Candidatus Magasanikbacteria bacterium]